MSTATDQVNLLPFNRLTGIADMCGKVVQTFRDAEGATEYPVAFHGYALPHTLLCGAGVLVIEPYKETNKDGEFAGVTYAHDMDNMSQSVSFTMTIQNARFLYKKVRKMRKHCEEYVGLLAYYGDVQLARKISADRMIGS